MNLREGKIRGMGYEVAFEMSENKLQQRYFVKSACALTALALHFLLLAPVMFGGGRHSKPDPTLMGAPSSGQGQPADDAMTVMWIEESSNALSEDESLEQMALSSDQLKSAVSKLDLEHSLKTEVVDDEETAPKNNAKGEDDADAAAIYGRYMGQLTARIERAWIRPRSSLGGGEFQCRVRIEQDRQGGVKEVTLQKCNGDSRWQLSLVRAIQSASPLPAPPDPRVFTSFLTLELDSAVFEGTRNSDAFEPALTLPRS